MERTKLIDNYCDNHNPDSFINPNGWKPGRPLKVADSYAKSDTVLTGDVLNTKFNELLKPSIKNTGVFVPYTEPVAAPSKPADANSPLVLIPNVQGGLKTSLPTVVNDTATKILSGLGVTPPVETVSKATAVVEAPKTAGFTLPNIKIIIGLVVGALVLFFVVPKLTK
jgi:hypothetical protein